MGATYDADGSRNRGSKRLRELIPLVLAGNDEAHPRPISDETAKLLPNSEYITEWKEGAPLEAAKLRVKEFLAKHTPAQA